MRCNNCGWDNPVGARYCEKCNQPLEFSSFQPINSDYNPRATMVDAQQVPNPRATMVDTSSPQRDVVLCCMDDLNIGQITISSARDLGLVSGDVILIKNLRYQVK